MTNFRVFLSILAVFLLFSVEKSDADGILAHREKPWHIEKRHGDKFSFPKQGQDTMIYMPHYRTMKELGLTEDQWGDMKDLRKNLKEEMGKITRQHREDVLNILTPAQRDTLKIRRSKMRELYRDQRHRHRGDHRQRHRGRKNHTDPLREIHDYIENGDNPAKKTALIDEAVDSSTWGRIKNLLR